LDALHIRGGFADGPGDTTGGGIYNAANNREPIILRGCHLSENFALEGSSILNKSQLRIEESVIANGVIEGLTGCAILNTGQMAHLTLINTSVTQTCAVCPEIFQNINGAQLTILNAVNLHQN
jgi:hypothetical protein